MIIDALRNNAFFMLHLRYPMSFTIATVAKWQLTGYMHLFA